MTLSLYLTSAWDICLDASGNLAVVSDPTTDNASSYRVAQDVACACRVIQGDLWWNTGAGIPYWQAVLGQPLNVNYYAGKLQNQALTVPGVVSASVVLTGFANRSLTGQVQTVGSNGGTQTSALA